MLLKLLLSFSLLLSAGGAWASSADMLKLFWSGYEAESTALSRPTLGFELEGIFPGKNRTEAFAHLEKLIRERISTLIYPNHKLEIEHYNFKTRGGEPRQGMKVIFVSEVEGAKVTWEVKDDGSIKPPNPKEYVGVELVSPILYSKRDVIRFKIFVQELKNAGFGAEPSSAALQIHGGFSNGPVATDKITSKQIVAQSLIFLLFFSKIEKQLLKFYQIHPGRQHFALPMTDQFVEFLKTGQIVVDEKKEIKFTSLKSGSLDLANVNLYELIENYFHYRYWATNAKALFQFGTMEVRFMNSTVDLEAIDGLEELVVKVINAIKSKDAAFFELLNKHAEQDEIPLDVVRKHFNFRSFIKPPPVGRTCHGLYAAGA